MKQTNQSRAVKCAITIGALILSSTFTCAFSFGADDSSARQSATAGTNLLRSGRYEEALSAFKQAQSSASDRYLKGQALSDCGECCLKLRRYGEAKEHFSQAVPLLNGGVRGVGNIAANTALARWGLAEFVTNNYPAAELKMKQAIDNSLGMWTYNYSDLASAPTYIQALAMIANSKNGSGDRWYQYGEYELSQLVSQGGSRAVVAQMALAKLRNLRDRQTVRRSPSQAQSQVSGRVSDPYLSSPRQYMPSRARYGLNGTQDQFSNNPTWRQAW